MSHHLLERQVVEDRGNGVENLHHRMTYLTVIGVIAILACIDA